MTIPIIISQYVSLWDSRSFYKTTISYVCSYLTKLCLTTKFYSINCTKGRLIKLKHGSMCPNFSHLSSELCLYPAILTIIGRRKTRKGTKRAHLMDMRRHAKEFCDIIMTLINDFFLSKKSPFGCSVV